MGAVGSHCSLYGRHFGHWVVIGSPLGTQLGCLGEHRGCMEAAWVVCWAAWGTRGIGFGCIGAAFGCIGAACGCICSILQHILHIAGWLAGHRVPRILAIHPGEGTLTTSGAHPYIQQIADSRIQDTGCSIQACRHRRIRRCKDARMHRIQDTGYRNKKASSQPGGPLMGGRRIYIYIYIYI